MRSIFIFPFILILFASCSDEFYNVTNIIEQPKSPTLAEEYFPLTVGNEWVYKISYCDSIQNNCIISRYDTLSIVSDSIYQTDTFFLLKETGFMGFPRAIRSDSIFLYRESGDVFFCSNVDQDLIIPFLVVDSIGGVETEIWNGFYHLIDLDFAIYVPVGVMPVVNFQGQIFSEINGYSHELVVDNYYSKNIGLVKFTLKYLNSPHNTMVFELNSYSLN